MFRDIIAKVKFLFNELELHSDDEFLKEKLELLPFF
jgi:hypothetical protein